MQDNLPDAIIADLAVDDGEVETITATVRDVTPPSDDALENIIAELEMLMDNSVVLDITYQQMIRVGVSVSGTGSETD